MANRKIAESDATGTITADHVWGPDRALVKKDSTGGEHYYLYNGHGDVVQIVDRSGNVVNNYKYDEWGNILSKNETISNPFKYSGEVLDDETGLYYLRARYYDPTIGRFLNEDSVEGTVTNPLTLNVYSYVNNNPMMYVDPTGNISWRQYTTLFGGILDGLTGFSGLKSLFSWSTIQGLVQFGNAIIHGQVNFVDLVKSVGASFVEPFQYLAEHSKNVWAGKPTDQEVAQYGRSMGSVIQTIVGAVGGGGILGEKIVAQLGKICPKLLKVVDKVAEVAGNGADNIANGAKLKTFYQQAEKYGTGSIKELPDGRFRFYGEVKPPLKEGEMAGARLVREWNPETGAKRTWYETVDHADNIRQVRPDPNVTGGVKTHYMFDTNGNYTGSWTP